MNATKNHLLEYYLLYCIDVIENPSFGIEKILVTLKGDIAHIALEQQ
jgi:hypothetical protein